MKVYSFFAGDSTFLTTSRSIKKAQAIGREIMQHYLETCKYLGEEPTVGKEYFIPEEVTEEPDINWVRYLIETDPDIVVLDDEIYHLTH